jgi:hypothetical protein
VIRAPRFSRDQRFLVESCQSGRMGRSSDIETISGWIAAFCFWSEKGERVGVFEDTVCMLETKYEDRKRLVL